MRKLLVLLLFLPLLCCAQNSKKVKALQKQKADLQNTLKKSQAELDNTKKKVKLGQRNLDFLDEQLDNRLNYIHELEKQLNEIDVGIAQLQADIMTTNGEIEKKRIKLRQAMRYARAQKEQQSPLLFVLSAKTFTQMCRRAHYARQYVSYERNLGEQILYKQAQLMEAQNQLLKYKSEKNELLREVMMQRKHLNVQQIEQRKNVTNLKKQEVGLTGKVADQQKQLNALNKKIDELIAYEIEQARKKAEEEARKKREAEEAARKKKGATTGTSKTSSGKTSEKTTGTGKSQSTKPDTWLTPEDRQLNGTFEQNKGRLPVPITGQYMMGNRFGLYNVPGLKNVQLDNKGTNYIGKKGARARAVFDGVVSAVFQFGGTKNVLVRHGSYISVYCNLSSVIVNKGQKVKTRDILGSVLDDGSGNCVLHFQLRKETTKLNPEAWIGR